MITDARRIGDGETLFCDVAVVGAGPAGISLTLELARSSMAVVVLEAGGKSRGAKSQRLYSGSVQDAAKHTPPDRDRYRQLGGTTAVWGGRCMPFDAEDFARRDHVPHSGWPITRADLDPYYRRAQEYCECGRFVYRSDELPELESSEMIPGFRDGDVVSSTLERWSPPTRFGKRYRRRLASASKVSVLLNAVVLEIEAEAGGGSVSGLVAATTEGRRFKVVARAVVLAGGGLEVTRLLLASNRIRREGLGNHSDWLGRGYMCHVHGVVARVNFDRSRRILFGYERDADGVYCRRRLTLSEQARRRLGLLNLYAVLDRPLLGDPSHDNALLSLAFLAKRLAQRQSKQRIGRGKFGLYWWHLRNVLRGSPELVSFLPRFGRQRFLQSRRIPSLLVRPSSNTFHLYFHSEQAPDRKSRVSLSRDCDDFGVPKLHIDYRVSELDVESIYRAHRVIDEELRNQGCGSLAFEREDVRGHIRECGAVLGHHLGTTRMSDDPAHGVVDRHCRVHGVRNLYVAGASVFPTSGQAHPTLTVVALAIRLAEHLVAALRDG